MMSKKTERAVIFVELKERGQAEGFKNGGGVVVEEDPNRFGGGEGSTKVKVLDVYGGERCILRHASVKEGINGG